jgi:hypothetical protein
MSVRVRRPVDTRYGTLAAQWSGRGPVRVFVSEQTSRPLALDPVARHSAVLCDAVS